MTAGQLAALALGAVLVFWMVGAYNRLVALRNAIATAWGQIDEQLKRRHAALPPLVAALAEPLAGERHALDAVLAAQQQLQAAADAVRSGPVNPLTTASLTTAERVLASALARLQALLAQQPQLQAGEVERLMHELADADQRLGFARQAFNAAVDDYNAAARQFPTRIVARVFGLGFAGRV
jgi:LemA protein